MGRKIAFALSLLVLIVTGVLGIYNASNEWRGGSTAWQRSVTAGEVLYGVLGLATAYGMIRRRPWTVGTVVAWGVAVIYVPGVAVMAYGGKEATLGSALLASAMSALIAVGIVWTAKVRSPARQPV